MPDSHLSWAELRQMAAGEANAWMRFWGLPLGRSITRKCRQTARNVQSAGLERWANLDWEDIWNECQVAIYRAAVDMVERGPDKVWSIEGFLATTASRTILNLWRGAIGDGNRGRRKLREPDTIGPDGNRISAIESDRVLTVLQSIDDGVRRVEDADEFRSLMEKAELSESQQRIILDYLEGCTLDRIAERTGIPLNTVKSHLRRAKLRLAKAVNDKG